MDTNYGFIARTWPLQRPHPSHRLYCSVSSVGMAGMIKLARPVMMLNFLSLQHFDNDDQSHVAHGHLRNKVPLMDVTGSLNFSMVKPRKYDIIIHKHHGHARIFTCACMRGDTKLITQVLAVRRYSARGTLFFCCFCFFCPVRHGIN